MSNFTKPPQQVVQPRQEPVTTGASNNKKTEWSIRDTEFLLRLIMTSKIDGSDLEIAADAVKKIKEIHASIVSHKVFI